MSTLKCYTSILDPSTVSRLKEKNIRSVVDFLHETPENIVKITKLPFKDVLEIRQKLIDVFKGEPRSALDLYTEVTNNYYILSTGISEIDQLIGGLESGHIYELCGLSGAGKTQICLSIAAHTSVSGRCVHFIDTKNDFSTKRIFNIINRRQNVKNEIVSGLERIKVTKIFNFYQLISTLHWLKNLFSLHHIPLVIIDCISTCYFSCVGSERPIGMALLNHAASLMKCITSQNHSVIVITNLATRYFSNSDDNTVSEKSTKPCLGNYWQQVSDIRLTVKRDGNSISIISVDKNNLSICNDTRRIDLCNI